MLMIQSPSVTKVEFNSITLGLKLHNSDNENFALFSVDKVQIKNTLSNHFERINNNLREKKIRGDVKFCTFDAFGGMFIKTNINNH